ncbi:MAG: hypothetical protein AAF631_11225, partial [Pseudomonadota bacterium]
MTPVTSFRTAFAAAFFAPVAAEAHASDQAFVLLLPTGVYTAVGVLVVAATVLLIARSPDRLARAWAAYAPLQVPGGQLWLSGLSAAVLAVLLLSGVLGSR